MEKQECKDSVSDQLISWQLMPLWTRNTTWMPTNEPFQWTPYHAGYYVTLDGIHFRGKELFSDRPLGDFQLDRNLVWSVRAASTDEDLHEIGTPDKVKGNSQAMSRA